MVSSPNLSNIMGWGLDHSRIAIQTCQFSQLLCPEFFLLLHHNTSASPQICWIKRQPKWRVKKKKACKIEQTCQTDLHMLLGHKLKKRFHYKKKTFVKHFSQIQKESFEILQSASCKQSKQSSLNTSKPLFLKYWFQNWASCNDESQEHNRARVNQHPPVHHDGWTVHR